MVQGTGNTPKPPYPPDLAPRALRFWMQAFNATTWAPGQFDTIRLFGGDGEFIEFVTPAMIGAVSLTIDTLRRHHRHLVPIGGK